MALPLCARVDFRDIQSIEALESDGWRQVGICDVWNGEVEGKIRGARMASEDERGYFCDRIGALGLSGRLWRDPKISKQIAARETKRLIRRTEYMFVQNDGFGIFTRRGESLSLDLIGCLNKKSGVAQDIIRSAIASFETIYFRAGTYSDNIAARRLYEVLGMHLNYSNVVFHK